MGGSVISKDIDKYFVTHKVDEIVEFIRPVYYSKSPLLPHEKAQAVKVWRIILKDTAKEFHRRKREEPELTPCVTTVEFFSNRLYRRLVDIHPYCQNLFSKSTMDQGTLLIKMVTLLVNESGNNEVYATALHALALRHCLLGVRSAEYSAFGEALFWALKLSLGDEYDAVSHNAWVKIYSRALDLILPVVVNFELLHREELRKEAKKRTLPSMTVTDKTILRGDVPLFEQEQDSTVEE